ncbi:MAG TPA: thioredoxin family protein [Solirubrobacteraceae bacterium]|nr:thioredoxin family protein [Solirubrobacteraceae bacterium]
MALELLALVKHDCPVCDQLLPALDAAGVRVLSQSSAEETAAQAARLGLRTVPELDDELALSERFDPDAVPVLLLLDGGEERDRVEGIQRERLARIAAAGGAQLRLDGLPDHRPGCGSRTRDPDVAARLAARRARAEGRIRSRTLSIGGLEDPFEALHERGLTDGLPVVPPTPERVVALLEHTRRDPQDVVGVVPPYGGEATVEKVAINAVMAGCAGPELPIVLAAVEAACDEAFALHGLLATTHPAGPVVVVSGPAAARAGMNAGGNALGQGTRANLAIGRALQLVVRNVGGGRPGIEDRAAHGQPGKVGCAFAERLDEAAPWPGLAHERLGLGPGESGVTVMALEAPRVIVDQIARDADGVCASFALALEGVSSPRLRLAMDALLLVGPEHGRLFAQAGWSRAEVQERLHALTHAPAGTLARGVGGVPEGIEPRWITDPKAPVAKFAGPDRILLAYAGGDAGLFSMVFGGWVSGEVGSAPVSRSVEPWR